MGLTVLGKQLVRNVQSIQGLTQAINAVYFLQAIIHTVAQVFRIVSVETLVYRCKFLQISQVNLASSIHRAALIVFNIQRPQNWPEIWKLYESMAVELFFISKKYWPANENFLNYFADLVLLTPYLVNGARHYRGEKTFYNKSSEALILAIEKVLHLEVSIETSRDLQRIQYNLRNEKEIHQIHKELRGFRNIIESRLDEEIRELTELKQMLDGNLNDKVQKDRELEQKEQRLRRGVPDPELDQIIMQRKEIDLAQNPRTLPEEIRSKKGALDAKILAVTAKLRKAEAPLPAEEAEIENLQKVLRRLKFVYDMKLLNEEIDYLNELKDHPYKLTQKKTALSSLITFIEDTFIFKSEIVTQFQETIKTQTVNSVSLSDKIDIQRLKIAKDIAQRFDRLYDIKYLEQMTAKLLDCHQLVLQLKNATEPLGMMNAVVRGPNDPQKKVDFYMGINAEITLIKELLNPLEARISAGYSEELNEKVKTFKAKVLEYFTAVQNIFGKEAPPERIAFFERADLAMSNVEMAQENLRAVFKGKHKELLTTLIKVKNSLDKPVGLNEIWQRYSRPWSKIAFGLSIIAVRAGKHFKWITPHSKWDLVLDACFFAFLLYRSAFSVIFKKNRALIQDIEVGHIRA